MRAGSWMQWMIIIIIIRGGGGDWGDKGVCNERLNVRRRERKSYVKL